MRGFQQHKIRKIKELSGRLWDFTALENAKDGEEPPGSEKGKILEQDRGKSKSEKMFVPGCAENCPGYENYRGKSSWWTQFEAQGNVRIVCEGVSHFGEIFVDGKKLAEHYGSYTAFSGCATDLKPGVHLLEIIADNAFAEEYSLDFPNDYYSYGGVTRDVMLEEVPFLFLSCIHVTPLTRTKDGWRTRIEVFCRNLSGESQFTDLRGEIAGTVFSAQHILVPEAAVDLREKNYSPYAGNLIYSEELTIANVETWSLENPALYKVSVELVKNGEAFDDLIERIGFRTVRVDGSRILLNGKALRIKGFCRHEDHPQYGCALPESAMAADLQLIRDMGGNSVRTVHYPNDEAFLDMCDEMGILVWEENHARGMSEEQMRNPLFEAQCEAVIREMIWAHYNHPSIYVWGVLNECSSDTEYGRSCYNAQFSLMRKLDKSRPCTYASCKFQTDICQDLPDICSWNMYPYWYEQDTATERLNELCTWLKSLQKPLLVSEIGAGAVYGFRSRGHEIWSEELQADILRNQLRETAEFEACSGSYIWQFADVKVSREWALRRPKSRNNKGIVDEYRRPKMAYEVVKEIYSGLGNYREG